MGAIKRRLDYRFGGKSDSDKKYLHIMKAHPLLALPSIVDLRPDCSPVENQGQIGSCSAHGAAGGVEFLQLQELKKKISGSEIFDPNMFERVSRNFIYWCERDIEGTTTTDAGATTLRDTCLALQTKGVCRETLWPYGPDNLFTTPSDDAYADALLHLLPDSYALESDLYQMKHCLWSGFPFMLGMPVFESFESEEVAKTGIMPMPEEGEANEGGHCVLAVGYNSAESYLIIRNSWGNDWGIDGYFHMPYDYATQYCDDFFTLRTQATANP